MSDADTLRAQAAGIGVALDPSQASRLIRFEKLLADRAIPLGVVSSVDATRIRERHILDSLRAAPIVEGADLAADLGSGAGLPGIVIAVSLPRSRMLLVERRPRRAALLELAVEELRLPNAAVFAGPVSEIPDRIDVALARAFAPLDEAWAQARGVLRPGGRLVYFAGAATTIPAAPKGSVILDVLRTPVLESSGALVIMAGQ
ncbi:MAG TPA: RsmG family class I SAM-dependent methyltransferase [Actinomycetota bacterium]|nr:RsmG family class I SAM-dependent methyltransferase [Actinomycetota bacterium]